MSVSSPWQISPPFVWRLDLNSSVVEGSISLLLDVFIICLSEHLCQRICSSYNLRIVYGFRRKLRLRTRRSAFPGEFITGPSWITYVLSVSLTLCIICASFLGFAVNGQSEGIVVGEKYQTYASIPWPPQPVNLDYKALYRAEPGEQTRERPKWVSKKLIAMTFYDKCQVCFYDYCDMVAYGFKDDLLEDELVDVEEEVARLGDRADCITNDRFQSTITTMRFLTESTPKIRCEVKAIDIGEKDADNFIDANITVGDCNLEIKKLICYKRPNITLHCAGVGQVKGQNTLGALVVHNADKTSGFRVDTDDISISSYYKFSDAALEKYTRQIAVISSIDIIYSYQIGFVPFINIQYNQTLFKLTGEQKNVSDLDLRLLIPCLTIMGIIVIIFSGSSGYLWYTNVYKMERRYFNTFSTVPELLEVLHIESKDVNRSGRTPWLVPEIGIRKDIPELGIQSPGEEMMSGAEWDEEKIL